LVGKINFTREIALILFASAYIHIVIVTSC